MRSTLHGMGYRFRLHVKYLPGTPDIVLPKHHTVIFVHGCFWHRHPGCKHAYVPKSRKDFWNKKLKENSARHEKATQELKELGWRVITVWECELSNIEALGERVSNALNEPVNCRSA